jgi:hypothetical protein
MVSTGEKHDEIACNGAADQLRNRCKSALGVFHSDIAKGAPQQCAVTKLNGRYVFSGQGTHLHDGAFSFDGNGTFTGKQTSVRDRNFAQRETLHGTYALDADCTGVMMMEGQRGGIAHWDIFMTEDGKKGRMIRTDAGTTAVRTFEQ